MSKFVFMGYGCNLFHVIIAHCHYFMGFNTA